MKYDFTIGGQRVVLSKEQVIRKLKGVKPARITEHMVLIDGEWHPLKKALSIVTGLDLLKFQTAEALRVFERLDFKVDRLSNRSER
jgi:hypothetical protein